MKVIINRIEIHQDKHVDLYFNFKQLNNLKEKHKANLMSNIRLVLNKRLNCLFLYQPEGISMAVPMKNGGMNPIRVVFYVILSGITTGVGAFLVD